MYPLLVDSLKKGSWQYYEVKFSTKKYAMNKSGCRTVSNNGSGSGLAPAQNILAV